MLNGRAAEALELIQQAEGDRFNEYLLLYCLASGRRNTEIADRGLESARKETAAGNLSRQTTIALLAAENAPSIREIERLGIPSKDKAVVCVALGFAHPDSQKTYFKLAERYNFTPEYPQRLLRKCCRATPASQLT